MPSGNSVAANVLLRLYHILGKKNFFEISTKILENQGQLAAENPFAFGYLLNVLYLYTQIPREITILNDKDSKLITKLNTKFIPESIMVLIKNAKELMRLRDRSIIEFNFLKRYINLIFCKVFFNFFDNKLIVFLYELSKFSNIFDFFIVI